MDAISRSRGLAAAAGAASAAVALGVTELAAGIGPTIPSLISAVGDIVIERTPGDIVHLAIDALGSADKPVLVWSIVVVSLLIGAALGIRSRIDMMVAWVGFGLFAVLGAFAGIAAPLANPVFAVLAAVAGAAAGLMTRSKLGKLQSQLHDAAVLDAPESAVRPDPDPTITGSRGADRRGFLQAVAGAGVVAAASGLVGRLLMRRSVAEASRAQVALPTGGATLGETAAGATSDFSAIEGLTPYITPNDDFYRIDTALLVPQVDASDWKMSITGMVDQELEFTLDDLLAEDLIEETITIACVSNPLGGQLIGNAVWTGVPLARLLERAGVQNGATQVVGRSVDGWTAGFPTEIAMDGRPAMVAVGMNGEPLPVVHGFPARLIVPGVYGYVSATKWLSEIELTTWEDFDGYWIPRGWSKLGPVKTQSRIDVPKNGFTSGPGTIAGVAWAVGRGITKVEVLMDAETEWREARLGTTVSDLTWVQWALDWDPTPGSHFLAVRATDGDGYTQTATPADVAPDGATGYHNVAVRPA